jgi:chromosome segregation ATPase
MLNNEEIERKMNFIVEQQAQFASDIQQLQESQARTDQVVAHTSEVVAETSEVVARTVEAVGQMGDVVTRLANVTHAGFTEVNAKINALADAQIRTEENLARTDEHLARTDENLNRTDENLKSFIAVVDRYLSGRNGK